MSLIGTEIAELRIMQQQLIDGELTPKECNMRLKVYKATADRERMILDIYKLTTLKSMSMNKITKTGLFSSDELLPSNATMFDDEVISCPDLEANITRSECLDYSGDTQNSESCSTCPNFKVARDKLLP